MTVRFLAPARVELDDAIGWYASRRADLGQDFLAEILDGLDHIQQFPNAWPSVDGSTRRFLLSRFPYSIIYEFYDSELVVIAIAHHKRRPEYWRQRRRPT